MCGGCTRWRHGAGTSACAMATLQGNGLPRIALLNRALSSDLTVHLNLANLAPGVYQVRQTSYTAANVTYTNELSRNMVQLSVSTQTVDLSTTSTMNVLVPAHSLLRLDFMTAGASSSS